MAVASARRAGLSTPLLRRSSLESSLASSAAAAAPSSGSETTGLRKQVAVLFLKNKGGLRTLASEYGVSPQSCTRYVTAYREKMPAKASWTRCCPRTASGAVRRRVCKIWRRKGVSIHHSERRDE